jgi:hypothetical protein
MTRLLLIGALAGLLPVAGVTAQTSPAPAPDTSGEEIICKKELETGSLVRKRKQCHTRAEWEKITESQVRGTRRMADEMMGGMNCNPGAQSC